MDRSKETATVVALREVGYDIEPSGVEVTQVVSGAPADGKLRRGDRIAEVDGAPSAAPRRSARRSPATRWGSGSASGSTATRPRRRR